MVDFSAFVSQPGCGISGVQTIKIVGGEQIQQYQYPWLCSLKSSGSHICGVTLLGIHPHVRETILVGAAHCYTRGNRYTVTCGEYTLDTTEPNQIDFDVTEVIVHPNYKGADKGFDIAIFKVHFLMFLSLLEPKIVCKSLCARLC